MPGRPRILLLGGNGYLGPHVVRELERDCDLRVTDVVPVSGPHETMQVDAADYRQVRAAAEGTDAIVNCSVSRRDRRGAFDVNTRGTWNALRAAVEAGHRRFVNTGPRFTLAGRRYLAWDFGIVIKQCQAGASYRWDGRLVFKPDKGESDIWNEYQRWMQDV